MHPKTIGLVAHTGKPGVAELIRAVAAEFQKHAVAVRLENETAALVGEKGAGTASEVARASELLVVLGGDGTILNVVARICETLRPIFGINVGSLGFLTCANSSAYAEAVAAIATGKISYSERALLAIELRAGGETTSSLNALNDAVISRGEVSRLIKLRAKVNGEPLTEFNADGLIIATPTGSTAYSLSAGGPILEPSSGVLVITPISPHVLTNRSVIVSDQSVIEVAPARADHPVFLTIDGREPVRVPAEAEIVLRRAKANLQLGFLPDVSFFKILRQKLKWSGSNV